MKKSWDPFWVGAFQKEFVPALKVIVNVLEERLLPTLENEIIDAEANRVEEEAWERYRLMPGTGNEDPVFKAMNVGFSHYIIMHGIRQGAINLFAVALYHAFEQQVMEFHRKNMLYKGEEDDLKKFNLSEFQKRIALYGIIVSTFSSWPKVYELRLIANTVKHAEGNSSQKLRDIRPDIFRNPALTPDFHSPEFYRVKQPLIGEGLYVSLQDIKDYCAHLVQFWEELADVMSFEI